MYELLRQTVSRMLHAGKALATSTSRAAGKFANNSSGSAAIEYAIWVSGIGATIAGPVSYLGLDLVSAFERVELTLCQRLMTNCILWGG